MVLTGAESIGRALTKWKRNGRAPYSTKILQKALRTEPCHRIYDDCLPFKKPTCHRKTNRRIAQMHHSHKTPPDRIGWFLDPQGRNINSIGTITTLRESNKAPMCQRHGTEVIGVIRRVKKTRGVRYVCCTFCAISGDSQRHL